MRFWPMFIIFRYVHLYISNSSLVKISHNKWNILRHTKAEDTNIFNDVYRKYQKFPDLKQYYSDTNLANTETNKLNRCFPRYI